MGVSNTVEDNSNVNMPYDIHCLSIAVDKAQKYLNTKELPSSWKREEILGTLPSQPSAASTSGATSQQQSKQSSSAAGSAQSSDTDSVSVDLYKRAC